MDVGSNPAQLKRCSSAPMINDLDQGPLQPPPTPPVALLPRSSPTLLLFSSVQPRTRRFSATFSPLNSPACPSGSSSPVPTRVTQLKQEEGADPVGIGRELAREKELQSTLQLSQSWEDLTLTDVVDNKPEVRRPASACTDPLQLTLPNAFAAFTNSPHPSPTRMVSTRQCFSPSMQIPVRNTSYSPTPSPSPTRKAFLTSRRSLSPITMRPATFAAVKRKCDLDSDKELNLGPPTKRPPQLFSSLSHDKSSGFLLTRALTPTSLDLVGSLGSVGTPESFYSTGADSPAALSPANGFLHMDANCIPSTSSSTSHSLPVVGGSSVTSRTMGVSPLPFHSLALSSRACSSTSSSDSSSTSSSNSPRPAESLKEFVGVGEEEELVTLLKDSAAKTALILQTSGAGGEGRACDIAKKLELMEAEPSETSEAMHIDTSHP